MKIQVLYTLISKYLCKFTYSACIVYTNSQIITNIVFTLQSDKANKYCAIDKGLLYKYQKEYMNFLHISKSLKDHLATSIYALAYRLRKLPQESLHPHRHFHLYHLKVRCPSF